ncbi:MAG: ATP-binding protein [Gammaproteobacteria bacterium]
MSTEKTNISLLITSILFWSILLGGSLFWNIHSEKNQAIQLATLAARENFNKDQAFRLWASKHGGVYVPTTEHTPPNPALGHLPNRDIETQNGTKLTLMNPAYMLRQMRNDYAKLYGIKTKITAEVLLNPINAPDEWELNALNEFKKGVKEITAQAVIDGKPYLRLMRPMFMKQSCMKCHGHLGFKVGQLRGGVGVAIPLEHYFKNSSNAINFMFFGHFILWGIGIIGIFIFYHYSKQWSIGKRQSLLYEQNTLQAEKSNEEKSKFLSRMSHELRTPLNSIIGFTQLLQLESKGELQQEYCSEVLNSSRHLLNLINEVLDLSKIESGQIDLSIEDLNYYNILKDSISMVSPLTSGNNIKIELKEPENKNSLVAADKTRLKQIIVNLLSNAIKYNKNKGEVIVDTSISGNKVKFSFSDTGIGLTSEQISKLFIPFNRLHSELTDIEGTGIGLSISRKLIEAMGGEIGVESENNNGSVFWFDLPFVPGSDIDLKKLSTNKNNTIQTENKENFQIIYIDDNESNLKLVKQIIKQRKNIDIITILDSTKALEIIKSNKTDLILLDIHMPKLDGYEFLKLLQQDSITALIPVIAITASAMDEEKQRGKNAGFKDYITKPIDIKKFFTVIDSIL